MRIVGIRREKITLYQNILVVLNISVSQWVAKPVTLGFVIVIKATSSKLPWISMNTGAIPDPGRGLRIRKGWGCPASRVWV